MKNEKRKIKTENPRLKKVGANRQERDRPYKILAFTLLAIILMVGSAWAEEAQIFIGGIDTSRYPLTSFIVSLRGWEEIQRQVLMEEHFRLWENGKTISEIKVEPISQEPEPLAIALVLDVSGSMLGKPLEDAKVAARLFIEQMKPQDQVAIVAFSSRPSVVSALTGDRNALLSALAGLQAKGETALYDAILSGLDILSPTGLTHKNLIVLSDGKDTKSINSLQAVLDRTKATSIPIVGIGLQSSEFDPASLQSISESSGSTLLLAPDSAALGDLYTRLARELHNQYRITYTSKQSAAKELKLQLEIKTFGVRADARATISNPQPQIVAEPEKVKQRPTSKEALRTLSPLHILIGAIILSFLAASLLISAILSIFFSSQSSLRNQMKFYEAAWKRHQPLNAEEPDNSSEKSWSTRVKDRFLKAVDYIARQRGFTEMIQLKLEQAGLPLRPIEFISLHFLFTLVLGIVASAFARNIATLIMVVGIVAALPIFILYILISRRRARFHEQLPDTLAMIAGSIRAGYSFVQAISVAVEETLPPMSTEFQRVLAEARLGLPLEEALERMAQRVGEQNFFWTVMAINIQREVGGNLAEVLEILADTIRDRDRVGRQIKILTAEGRLSAIILIVLPFVQAFLLFIVNPSYMSLLVTTGPGLVMVGMASVLMLIGGMWLKKIISIEV